MLPGVMQLAWVTPMASPSLLAAPPATGRGPATRAARGPSLRLTPPPSVGVGSAPGSLASSARSTRLAVAGRQQEQAIHNDTEQAASANAVQRPADAGELVNGLEKTVEWSFQQVLSIFSGILASLFSLGAYNRQREASKSRSSVGEQPETANKSVRIVQQLGGSLLDTEAESPLFSLGPVPRCTVASDLRRPGRHITIITTASLPWLTGTAVNPLLRALGLARRQMPVVLVLPWLGEEEQRQLFPNGKSFASPEEQELSIAAWCKERASTDISKLPLQIRWYNAMYQPFLRSVFPSGDVSAELNPDDPKDVLILEEPEHLCWYHHGQRWPGLFQHVIGIVHTNYQDYLVQHQDEWPDSVKELSVYAASTLVCSAYCDVNIKLSDTIMPLPNEVTCNVHGVRDEFLAIGDQMGSSPVTPGDANPGGVSESQSQDLSHASAYYIGKAVTEKGWGELLDFLEAAGDRLKGLALDGYGSGADFDYIETRAKKLPESGAIIRMSPGRDHADEAIHKYGVLVNASTTDVLCTVTVEALAMGKQCVLARHASNRFFEEYFPERCHFFRPGDVDSFIVAVRDAVAAGKPQSLPPASRHLLTWEAASERLFTSAEVRVLSGPCKRPSEAAASLLAYRMHFDLMEDGNVAADFIKDATFGHQTPWDEYLDQWRRQELARMRDKALQIQVPVHIQEHERYLKDKIAEILKPS